MTDFSPELLEARERLLQGIMATWPQRQPPAAQPLVSPTYPISLESAKAVAERYRQQWLEAVAERDAVVASGAASRADGHWHREHRARGLYATALALVEGLQ